MTWTVSREFWVVLIQRTRREYVCVWQEEQGDHLWYNEELAAIGYRLAWQSDKEQVAEMHGLMWEHGYRRILAMRDLTAHEVIRNSRLPNPRPLTLTVEL